MSDAIATPRPSVVWQRRDFLLRTYGHLMGAIIAFLLLETVYFTTGFAETVAGTLLSVNWLLVLGGFIVVGFMARGFAAQRQSRTMQYVGLGGYVLAESIIFVPLLFVAESVAPGAIASAGVLTIIGFVGLTVIAFTSGTDLSFVSGLLKWGGVLALVIIVAAVLFGLHLGAWFAIAMIGLAGAAILFDTGRALTTMPDDAYVGAALELFSSVALMFWYAIALFSSD